MATISLEQQRRDAAELPLVTCGNEVQSVTRFLPTAEATSYGADDVIDRSMSERTVETLQSV